MELLEHGISPLPPAVTETDERAARRSLRLQIARLERALAEAFVTAYRDRGEQAFKKTFGALAWNTLIWFVAKPDHVVILREKPSLTRRRIFDLIREDPEAPADLVL